MLKEKLYKKLVNYLWGDEKEQKRALRFKRLLEKDLENNPRGLLIVNWKKK